LRVTRRNGYSDDGKKCALSHIADYFVAFYDGGGKPCQVMRIARLAFVHSGFLQRGQGCLSPACIAITSLHFTQA